MKNNDLRLIVLESAKNLGNNVNKHLNLIRNTNQNYIVPIKEVRFNNGEGKIQILETIRDMDTYILSDIGNHSITYPMYDYLNHKSPDDHFQDIKRVIYAIRDHSKSNSVIMPLLYSSRQHRRKGRESLDCATSLQDLINLKVKNIITFDVHDIDIQNAIPVSSFESVFATKETINEFLNNEEIDFRNMFVVAPDAGAISRANLYANLFKCNLGFFRKERDTSRIVDGKNPIVAHQYVGSDLKGKNVLVSDDMIASGESILDVAKRVKELGAKKVYLFATFSLFTGGIETFKKFYEDGYFDRIYTTNLTYFNPLYKKEEWLVEVDCSKKIAEVINNLNYGLSLSPLLNESDKIDELILRKTK